MQVTITTTMKSAHAATTTIMSIIMTTMRSVVVDAATTIITMRMKCSQAGVRKLQHKYTEEEHDYLLKALSETDAYGTILRSKGIIQMTDGNWKQFDLVPQEYEVRDGNADYAGRMVVIGTDLKEDELAKLFHVQ